MLPPTGIGADAVLAELDERRGRDPDVHGARLFGLVYPTGGDDLERLARRRQPALPVRQRAQPVQVPRARRARGRGRRDDRRAACTCPRRRRLDDVGRHRVDPHVDAREPRARAGARRRAAADPRAASPRTPRTRRPRTTSAWRSCASRSTTTTAPTSPPRRGLIGPATAVVVASAFNYPYGVMDPVDGARRARRGARRRAVTSTRASAASCSRSSSGSASTCRRGTSASTASPRSRPTSTSTATAPKGASVVLHRDPDWFGHQVFLYDQWPSGLYGSPGRRRRAAGARRSRPRGRCCATSASTGYVEIMRDVMATTAQVRAAIDVDRRRSTIVGDPIGPVLAMQSRPERSTSTAVGDAMDDRGWHLNRIVDPPGLHLMLSPAHAQRRRRAASSDLARVRGRTTNGGTRPTCAYS